MIVPSLVKGFKDVNELFLAQTVEVSDDRIQFVNHSLLLVIRERPVFHADLLGPVNETVIGTGEATGDFNDALAERIVRVRTWNWEGIQDEEGDVSLNKSPCIPIKGK